MTFSKLSFIAAICLGLLSCSGIEPQPADYTLSHTSTPGACCKSDGSDCDEPQQESAQIQKSRQRMENEAPQDDVGCIMPSVVE